MSNKLNENAPSETLLPKIFTKGKNLMEEKQDSEASLDYGSDGTDLSDMKNSQAVSSSEDDRGMG